MRLGATASIADAVDELGQLFGTVDAEPDETGGAYVTIREIDLGERWTPRIVPLTFQLAFNYPYAAVYPYYCPAGVARVDGCPLPQAIQNVMWRGRPVLQISLRANRWSPAHDSAAGAVEQVRRFFQTTAS
jgi:hypothetical protein